MENLNLETKQSVSGKLELRLPFCTWLATKLKNGLFTLLTFNFYFPWAISEFRRVIAGATYFVGKPFSYHGTGYELFAGYIIASLVYFAVVLGYTLFHAIFPPIAIAFSFSYLLLFHYAIFRSRVYLASRTEWNGVRFAIEKSVAWNYVKLGFWTTFLSVLSLGFYSPIAKNRTYSFLVNHLRYGNRYLSYKEENDRALMIGLKGFFLSLLTFGIYSFWARKNLLAFRAECTSFEDLKFKANLRSLPLLLLSVARGLCFIGVLASVACLYFWAIAKLGRDLPTLSNSNLQDALNTFSGVAVAIGPACFFVVPFFLGLSSFLKLVTWKETLSSCSVEGDLDFSRIKASQVESGSTAAGVSEGILGDLDVDFGL